MFELTSEHRIIYEFVNAKHASKVCMLRAVAFWAPNSAVGSIESQEIVEEALTDVSGIADNSSVVFKAIGADFSSSSSSHAHDAVLAR